MQRVLTMNIFDMLDSAPAWKVLALLNQIHPRLNGHLAVQGPLVRESSLILIFMFKKKHFKD